MHNLATPLLGKLLGVVLLGVALLVESTHALQLHDVPTNFPAAGSAAGQKLIVTVRDRSVWSRMLDTEAGQDTRTMVMRGAHGQRYACKVPIRKTAAAAAAEQVDAAATELASRTPEEAPEPKSPLELLDQLSALCLYRQEGMWTYEVCYKKHARQFRQAMQRIGGGGVHAETLSAEDFSCGKYSDTQDFSVKFDFSTTGLPMTYIAHNLTDGAPCIMTGATRTSEVRFTCMPHAKDNLLVMVKEFPTCNYIYVVATPFLCSHPQFQPRPQRTHTLRCAKEVDVDWAASAASALSPPSPAAAVPSQREEGTCQEGQDAAQCSAEGRSPQEEGAALPLTTPEDAGDREEVEADTAWEAPASIAPEEEGTAREALASTTPEDEGAAASTAPVEEEGTAWEGSASTTPGEEEGTPASTVPEKEEGTEPASIPSEEEGPSASTAPAEEEGTAWDGTASTTTEEGGTAASTGSEEEEHTTWDTPLSTATEEEGTTWEVQGEEAGTAWEAPARTVPNEEAGTAWEEPASATPDEEPGSAWEAPASTSPGGSGEAEEGSEGAR